MKRFLGIAEIPGDPSTLQVAVDSDPAVLLARPAGQASPIFPALSGGSPASLHTRAQILFLLPTSPRSIMSRVQADLGDAAMGRMYLSHGSASLVLLAEEGQLVEDVIGLVGDLLLGYELWPVEDGLLKRDLITLVRNNPDAHAVEPISDAQLPYELAAQVRQFNSNLVYFTTRSGLMIPEVADLLDWVGTAVSRVVRTVQGLADPIAAGDAGAIRVLHHHASILVEVNAALTMLMSQSLSGAPSIAETTYPVGEYSLLGIGSAVRAVWRTYLHMARTFARANHQGRLEDQYSSAAPFNPGTKTRIDDIQEWLDSPSRIAKLTSPNDGPGRLHIIHFSSRWGFHETLHSISISWQCVHASASAQWNLLTLSHEFLHSHVRELLSTVLDQTNLDDLEALAAAYGRKEPKVAKESMQFAILSALQGLDAAEVLTAQVDAKATAGKVGIPTYLTAEQIRSLVREYMPFLHELVVHTLDYLYFYNADPRRYVTSIWNSWAMVPNVSRRLPHYLLRTICALASATASTATPREAFDEGYSTLKRVLEELSGSEDSPTVIGEALNTLSEPEHKRDLETRFFTSFYVVQLTRVFLYDSTLHADLVRDAITVPRDDGPDYALTPGDFPDQPIGSPIGFLLDRFAKTAVATRPENLEYESLWQMLLIVGAEEAVPHA